MKKTKFHIFVLSIVAFLACTQVYSQTNTSQKDSIATAKKSDTIPYLLYNFGYNQKGNLFLNNSSTYVISYDKNLNKYIIVEKIGNFKMGTPIFMSPAAYKEFRLKEDIKNYFKSKVGALSKKKGTKEAQKNLLPKYYVNSKFFESIFGGNTVEVIPTGNINIKLGGIYQNVDNPQLSENNRSSFTFDFDQQISLSLLAKIGKRLKVTANYDTQSTFDFQNLIKLEYTPTE
ncbi:MAG: hypothetical protein JKX72_00110, partial [Robiginitomaculum sp.]|nr:hypothetical protein [Robiginitomaculum sp.]